MQSISGNVCMLVQAKSGLPGPCNAGPVIALVIGCAPGLDAGMLDAGPLRNLQPSPSYLACRSLSAFQGTQHHTTDEALQALDRCPRLHGATGRHLALRGVPWHISTHASRRSNHSLTHCRPGHRPGHGGAGRAVPHSGSPLWSLPHLRGPVQGARECPGAASDLRPAQPLPPADPDCSHQGHHL